MKIRKTIAAIAAAGAISLAAACGATTTGADTTSSGTSSSSTTTQGQVGDRGAGGGVDVSSVTTEAQLIALIQEAYGDGSLGLHRGHQPVEDVLSEVLTISHDELHVRMNQGQNLAAVATDLGIDPQTLIDALVESWSPAIDNALAAGAITQQEAAEYRTALQEAFTFRVNWDGEQQTPTFSGVAG